MSNAGQAELWSGPSGAKWVEHQARMDDLLHVVRDLVLDTAAIEPGARVLDVGCGTGASTLPAAEAATESGFVLGADISPTLLALARARMAHLPQVQLLEGDVQTAALPGPFDVTISRFGVMFFHDTHAAFANIARAMVPGGRFAMAAWAEARDNPYFMESAAAARAVLGEQPKPDRSAPGPFAFEDRDRVRRDLSAAGLVDLEVEKRDVLLAPSGTLEAFAALLLEIGPAAGAVSATEAGPDLQARIAQELHARFDRFLTPEGLRVPASINLITARTAS